MILGINDYRSCGVFVERKWLWILVMVWEIIWKGMALWKAAKRGDKGCFMVLLPLNTLGILPIGYLTLFSQDKKKKKK